MTYSTPKTEALSSPLMPALPWRYARHAPIPPGACIAATCAGLLIFPFREETYVAFSAALHPAHSASSPISDLALEDLRRQRATQAAEKLAGDELGRRATPKAATNAFARIAKKAKISTSRLHDLRHTAATNLVRTTASILGHTSPTVTLGLYSHVMEGQERAAVDILADRLGKAVGERSA